MVFKKKGDGSLWEIYSPFSPSVKLVNLSQVLNSLSHFWLHFYTSQHANGRDVAERSTVTFYSRGGKDNIIYVSPSRDAQLLSWKSGNFLLP